MQKPSLHTRLKHAVRIDRALKFVWQASPAHTLLSGLLLVVTGFLPLLSLYLVKLIIDAVSSGDPGQFPTILIYIGLACCVGILTAFLNYLSNYAKKASTLALTDHMYCVIQEKSAEVDISFYESPALRDTLHRAQAEGPYRPASIVNSLFTAGQSVTSLAAVFWLICVFNPVLGIVILLTALPGVLLRLTYARKVYQWQLKRTEDERKAHYFNYMLTGDVHAREFRLFNLGPWFMEKFNSIRKVLKTEKLALEKKRGSGDFIAQSIATLSVFGSFIYIAHRAVQGAITIGDMVMYFQAFQRGLTYLKTFLESVAQMYEDNLFLSNLYDFLSLEPEVREPELPKPVPESLRKGIEFKNVNFFYPGCEKKVLNCVNFSINPGEVVALVGENGSGKSTIVKLISRLYDPTGGTIFLDNEDIRNFNTGEYRKKISILFQDPVKYQLSVKENIYLGDVARKDESGQIHTAAIRAGIHNKIQSFDSGYDTTLGRWFKDGEELSIGQWQMLAIARAFFRDADLVILDEPSSALDPETEMAVFSRFKELIQNRSALIISHRYSTVRLADRILVLENGTIVEQGTHDELIRLNGTYARYYITQARGYR